MLPSILNRFVSLMPLQSLEESASDPSQALSLHPNPRSEVYRPSPGDEDTQHEAPSQHLPGFFSGATGTIVRGPARFANTSGNHLAVHFHHSEPPAITSMNAAEHPDPVALMYGRPASTHPINTTSVVTPLNCTSYGSTIVVYCRSAGGILTM
ncbi:hypothetical protein M413DRAFT_440408 [Hebeloma cylindrosporum]|uniref:Uncharacterized protein n=1 Tax=Hebeloma cylindrosporum TaxID=76867 RepID=A0A0C3CSF4_HEBCY|nr:hypothetical protein M413DRAFT_440408 [Hebeloma cylindrosporum h7]